VAARFVHHLRPRYAEVDAQGVVFNAHWLTYFDESQTRFFESIGLDPKEAFFSVFDVMVVRAVLDWQGPAGFDGDVAIAVRVPRLGTSSFDIEYTATCDGTPACTGVITYVSVTPGTHAPAAIPADIRERLAEHA
jgi:acyl-CoA thioester hydrolase